MAEGKFVAYYRVSTAKQGRSGLGLEAQVEGVRRYLNGGDHQLIAEFQEVETGKGANAITRRPELKRALEYAAKEKATLIIAKLDRLARNVHFISGLLQSRVRIVAADMPDADVTMLQIYAVMAEHEARAISKRTKEALAAAKARGVRLGVNGAALAAQNKAEAVARIQPIADRLSAMRAEGSSVRAIASQLNADGVASPGGGRWHTANVHRALQRLAV